MLSGPLVRSQASSFAILLAAFLAAGVAGSGGCNDAPPPLLAGGGDQGGASSTGEGGAFVDNGKELWAEIEAEMVTQCGACHEPGGIGDAPFLAGPDRYKSVLAWPGVVTVDPAESIFVTYAVSGAGHTGTNLDTVSGGLFDRVKAWLAAEASAIEVVPDTSPHVEPFTPILGFNAVYLTPIDPALTGVALTFTAEELTATSLKLSDLTIHTTSVTGVHIAHPIFAVYPKGGAAEVDPVDSFAGLDTYFPESETSSLGVGTLILTNWAAEAKLGIGFETCSAWTEGGGDGGGGGGTVGGGCTAVEEFTANAVPQLQARCESCHGGANGQATAAVDMSDLGTNDAAACAQVKNRVNTTTPAQSQIFITTDPGGNAGHPFKFGGNAATFADFRDDLTVWIEAE